MKTSVSRTLVVVTLLGVLFAVGFVARAAARLEVPLSAPTGSLQFAPLVAVPLVHLLTEW